MKNISGLLLGFLLCTTLAFGADVNFQWGASSGQVDGYRIYWGDTSDGPYPNQLCETDRATLNYLASLEDEREYYLVCRAFNAYGESEDSNEVHWSYAVPGHPGQLHWSINLAQILKTLGAEQIQFVSK